MTFRVPVASRWRATTGGVVAALSLVLVALTCGCVPNRMFRPDSIVERPGHTLGFVEFDDQGELWAPSQFSRALHCIEEANRFESGAIVVVFVHGWNHNASPKEESRKRGAVRLFDRLLARVDAGERRLNPEAPRPVVGVYLGWRGKGSPVPGFNFFTFYNRGAAAKRIASTSATEVIYRVLTTVKQNPNSRSLLIGHSFGGMILERALAQALVGSVLSSVDRSVEFLADLVILVNPASQSIYAKQLVETLERNRIKLYRTDELGRRFERPLVVSVTSVGDWATRVAYPSLLYLKSLFGNFRTYDDHYCSPLPRQRSFYARTAGHNKVLFSHVVDAEPLPEGAGETRHSYLGRVRAEYDPLTLQRVWAFNGQTMKYTIAKRPRALNDTPYWIMRVPRSLIPDHSTIFGEDQGRLFAALLGITGALERGGTTRLVREEGVRPIGLAAFPSGEVLFLDRSRRLYTVSPDSPQARFLDCMQADLQAEPSDRIGFVVRDSSVLLATNRATGPDASGRFRTRLFRITMFEERETVESVGRLDSSRRFTAAAFDLDGRVAFLTPGDSAEVYVADLSERKPRPRFLFGLIEADAISYLLFDSTSRLLYAADADHGTLWAMDPARPDSQPFIVADRLGWPTAVAVDPDRGRLYVADAKSPQVWSLECGAPGNCSEPTSLVRSDEFGAPSSLAVAADGTLWVGDLKAQKLFAVAPEGEILNTVSRLAAE